MEIMDLVYMMTLLKSPFVNLTPSEIYKIQHQFYYFVLFLSNWP